MFASGALPLETLVWCEAVSQWVTASAIPGFRGAAAAAPQAPAATAPLPQPVVAIPPTFPPAPPVAVIARESAAPLPVAKPPPLPAPVEPPHPWLRFIARSVDTSVFLFTLTVGGIIAFRNQDSLWPMLLIFCSMVFWVVFEAMLLSVFGTTPAKALLGMRVESASGEKPTFQQALIRCAMVWVMGQGLGLPLISLIAQIASYLRLTAEGKTAWDERTKLRVRHTPCGAGRVAGMVALTAIYIFVLGFVTGLSNSMAQKSRVAAAPAKVAARPAVRVAIRPAVHPAAVASRPVQPLAEVAAPEELRPPRYAGTWIIRAKQRKGNTTLTWISTLVLDASGEYRQRIRVTGPAGVLHPEMNQDWSGTWTVDRDQLVETVRQSTTLQHPRGTWVYNITPNELAGLTLRRQACPEGLPGASTHPSYKYARATTVAETD